MKLRTALISFAAVLAFGVSIGWWLAVAFHQPKFEHSGWFISRYHGEFSTFAFAATNPDLERKVREFSGDGHARAFAIPDLTGYVLYYYTPHRLSREQDEQLRAYAEELLWKHDAEWKNANAKKA